MATKKKKIDENKKEDKIEKEEKKEVPVYNPPPKTIGQIPGKGKPQQGRNIVNPGTRNRPQHRG